MAIANRFCGGGFCDNGFSWIADPLSGFAPVSARLIMTMFSEKFPGTGELFIGRIYCQGVAVVYCAAARLSGSFRVVRMAI